MGAKAKPAGKPKAEGTKEVKKKGAGNTKMDPKMVTKMINFFRYRADQKGEEDKATALASYQAMGNSEKAKFLDDFIKNGGSKCKDWKWTHSYTKAVEVTEDTTMGSDSDFWTGHKILELNGFKWSEVEEPEKLLQDLLEENRRDYGHEYQEIKHEKNNLLHRYFYIHSKGTSQSRKVTEKECLERKTGDGGTLLKALGEGGGIMIHAGGASASSSSSSQAGQVQIKEEHPNFKVFQEKVASFKKTVTQLQQQVAQGQTLATRFEILGRNDPSLASKGDGLKAMIGTLDGFTKEATTLLCEMEIVKADDEKLSEYQKTVKERHEAAVHHQDGYKAMYRRHVAMIS